MTDDPISSGDDVEIEAYETRKASYTDIKDWVPLSGVSDAAVRYYNILRMHVNRKRGDRKVRATTLSLAKLMGRSRGDKTAPWLAELVAIQAVEVKRSGLSGRNVYRVREEPPPGYTGPVNLGEWYERNRAELDDAREIAKRKRDARREAQRAAKSQVNPVTPVSGPQGSRQSVTPTSGVPVAPMSGYPVTPTSGREPDVYEPDVLEPDEQKSLSGKIRKPRGARPTDNAANNQRETKSLTDKSKSKTEDPVKALVAELAQVAQAAGEPWKWADQRVRAALEDRRIAARPFPLVRAALLELAAQKHGVCNSPMLVTYKLDPQWWDAVALRMEGAGPPTGAPGHTVPGQRKALIRQCGLGCDDDGWLFDSEDPADKGRRCTHEAVPAGVS